MVPKFFFAPALVLLIAAGIFSFAEAQAAGPVGGESGANPFIVTGDSGLVANAVDPASANGLSANLTYNGTVSSQQSWMPTNGYTGEAIPATYQVYTGTSASGQAEVIMIPNEITTRAAQQNPQASGVTGASAVMTNAYGATVNPNASYSQFLAQQIEQQIGSTTSPASQGYVCGSSGCVQTASANQQTMLYLLNGNGNQQLGLSQTQAMRLVQNLGLGYAPAAGTSATSWVCGASSCSAGNIPALLSTTMSGAGLQQMLLVYTAQTCGMGPAGLCAILSAAQLTAAAASASAAAASLPTSAPQCHAPVVKVGRISASAAKVTPLYPLVVGQDESKRGADVTYSVSVEPTSYTTWTAVPQYATTRECNQKTGKCSNKKVFIGWKCVSNVTWYPESVSSAQASATLTQASRAWIESGDLQIHYPGAYLHHPDFGLGGGGGGFSGNTYQWALAGNLQVADPGEFSLSITGHTSGTPVHAGRSFSGSGAFLTYLREVVITK
ncbi:MAG: hypothetical protein NT121_24645 [Chloroflexi bacterium]|nr:hypothetical protein [Chloroflexota bacterium]